MVCSKCGKIVSDVTVFCPSCGESIDRKAQHDGLVVHSDDYYQVKDYQKRAKYVMLFAVRGIISSFLCGMIWSLIFSLGAISKANSAIEPEISEMRPPSENEEIEKASSKIKAGKMIAKISVGVFIFNFVLGIVLAKLLYL